MAGPRSPAPPADRGEHSAWVPFGILAGLAVASLLLIWLLAALLLSDGATWRVLLPWLLFLLPVLAFGAAAGWLVGLAARTAVHALRRA